MYGTDVIVLKEMLDPLRKIEMKVGDICRESLESKQRAPCRSEPVIVRLTCTRIFNIFIICSSSSQATSYAMRNSW